ncbi:MAG: Uma2 family endonuclease [Polyangiaceae bacterium]
MATFPAYQRDLFASDLRPGDRYELSDGRAIYCAPTGGDGSRNTVVGAQVLDTDPAVETSGMDAGFSPSPRQLRAPDIAVGNVPDKPGWIEGAPPLAVEYASSGQDEGELRQKIRELLAAGTRWVWVVRLLGERHVEVHEKDRPLMRYRIGEKLRAPGVLRNEVPVEAMFDRDVAHEVALRNLLQRKGYDGLESVRTEGRAEGREEGRVEGREEGRVEGREEGRKEAAAAMLHQLFERKLRRPLTEGERAEIDARLTRLGAARLGDVVLDLAGDALDAWLRDPAAV